MTVDFRSCIIFSCFSVLPGPNGNGHGAQALGAQLETDAGRPQAVARGDLDAVERGDARHLVAAGELRGPVDDVLLGVGA